MKMVKSLLLGSAAGVVAVATGQAADLPVKAKPVEYVKVCSLYGAGFFYIPGTDKCLKIGGYLREQWDIHGAGDGQVYMDTNGGTWTRGFTNDSSFRTRSSITFDVREQSSFGTVRGYTAVGGDLTTGNAAGGANGLYFTRSFVQFAGITAGKAVSFFDFLSTDPYLYASNIRPNFGNTGASGLDVFAYTAQLGNGVSATVSAEDSCSGNVAGSGASAGGRQCKVINSGVGPFAAVALSGTGSLPVAGTSLLTADTTQLVLQSQTGGSMAPGVATYNAQGYLFPDIVGALRADQAWGSAQLAGALHRNAGDYYFNATSATTAVPLGTQNNGHPGDVYGWAAMGGFLLKNVLGMQGDQFGLQANYSVGATSYITNAAGSLAGFSGGANGLGNSIAFGSVVDGVYSSGTAGNATTGTSIEMTTAWTAGGVYEHVWNPQWKTSVVGAYVGISYNDTAANYICNGSFNTTWTRGQAATIHSPVLNGANGSSALTSCDPNFSFWSLGTRTQWNPNSNLDLGLDFMWNHLNSANSGTYTSAQFFGGRPKGDYSISDYDQYTVAMRAQYNFLP